MPTVLLAIDPSLTCTGYAVVSITAGAVLEVGVIRTEKAPATERLLAGEDEARRGGRIFQVIHGVIKRYNPVVVAQEVNSGSQHANAAKALARAQQACHDAAVAASKHAIFVTPFAVKKAATGRKGATKDEVEQAMRSQWDIDADLFAADMKSQNIPKGKWENIFDALAVARAVWDHPAVLAHR